MTNKLTVAEKIKRGSLYCMICFWALGAIFAIVTVLTGQFKWFEIKVLLTAITIALASICALCCSIYTVRSGRKEPGLAGITLAVLSAALIICGLWFEIGMRTNFEVVYWKTTAILAIFAVAFAHSLALLCVRLPRKFLWLRIATTVNMFLIASAVSIMLVWEIEEDGAFRLVIVLAILAALATLIIPILSKVMNLEGKGETSPQLILTEREEGLYEDPGGNLYRVEKVEGDR